MSQRQTNLANDSTDPVVQINGDSIQVREIPGDQYLVINQTNDSQYVVDDTHCTCPSHKYHDGKCKHRRAVDKVEEIEQVKQEKHEEIDEYYEELLKKEVDIEEEVDDLEEVLKETEVDADELLEEIEEEDDEEERPVHECADCGEAMRKVGQGSKTNARAWADAYFKFKCPSCGARGSVEEQNRTGEIKRMSKGNLNYNGA